MSIDLTDPAALTLESVKTLVASCDDSRDRQFRIATDGRLFVSDAVGNRDLDGILCRYETMHAGNDYVGKRASNDEEYVRRLFNSFQKQWPTPESSYIDQF